MRSPMLASLMRRLAKHKSILRVLRTGTIFLSVSVIAAVILHAVEQPVEHAELEEAAEAWATYRAIREEEGRWLTLQLQGNRTAIEHLRSLLREIDELLGPQPAVEDQNWTYIGTLYFSAADPART